MQKDITLDTSINPKYCTRELGEILYRDKLMAISKYEKVANIMKKYSMRGANFLERIHKVW